MTHHGYADGTQGDTKVRGRKQPSGEAGLLNEGRGAAKTGRRQHRDADATQRDATDTHIERHIRMGVEVPAGAKTGKKHPVFN